ncbi:unnamed protein product [Pseudo-nitzschia multistriata]|uniref:CS domain-containing protein n=1 Tax=Pseudo-nitzschia multistriata TaxID=183589 RepID=A0A448Z315_9STRA|nr:unnamed protein product [Pseudo-nitzschia multistriata]
MSFQHVLIPAIESEPIARQEASKAGGLTNDALSKNAKAYFFEKSGGSKRAELLEKASAPEKKQIADRIRKQYTGADESSKRVQAMGDDEIVNLLKMQEQASNCEITCLTIPTPLNGQTAVSMYGDDQARTKNHPYNPRATKLMLACGHAFPPNSTSGDSDGKPNGIYGDVFVGRAIDDEGKDIWERVDLTPAEVEGDLYKQQWCKIARRKGGGGGQGGSASSLSKTLQNFQNQQQQMCPSAAVAASSGTPAIAADPANENQAKYTWSQTDDEVELKFVVPKETRAKNVTAQFGCKSLRVSLSGVDGCETNELLLCDGVTWDQIDVDGSTFTLQDEPGAKPTGRELCVSLEKASGGQTWNYAIEE